MPNDLLKPIKQTSAFSAWLGAGLTFFVLLGLLLVLGTIYDFGETDTLALAFILASVCAVLIAKAVYDGLRNKMLVQKLVNIQVEEVFRPQRLLFSEVYGNSPVAYVVANVEGKVQSANSAALRLFDKTPSAMVQVSFFSLFRTSEAEHYDLLVEKVKNAVAVSGEEVIIKHSDLVVWALLSVFPYINDIGQTQYLITLVDITKQKEVEVAKSEFVSLASHQLRTPITGMRWSAELLLMDGAESLSVQQKKYVHRLLESIERMNSLVDDFLQVSRFDLGTRTAQRQAVDLPRLVADIIEENRVTASGKKLSIHTEYDPAYTSIDTDLGLLRMIITNLYTNAVRYTKEGGQVLVSYRQEGDTLVIAVKDTGMGIPVAEQPHIFTKIFRASNALREVPDGTGLGLYIARKAVQVLGGRIDFISTEQVGTTFTVVIPIS